MFRVIISILSMFVIFLNITVVVYLYGLQTYKINKRLPSFYKYIFLENKIKTDFENLKGQNILIEKGSNRIIKLENYNVTANTIISGFFLKGPKLEKVIYKKETIKRLLKKNPTIASVTIEVVGKKRLDKFMILNRTLLDDIANGESTDGEYPQSY